jgi:hypothetical protein
MLRAHHVRHADSRQVRPGIAAGVVEDQPLCLPAHGEACSRPGALPLAPQLTEQRAVHLEEERERRELQHCHLRGTPLVQVVPQLLHDLLRPSSQRDDVLSPVLTLPKSQTSAVTAPRSMRTFFNSVFATGPSGRPSSTPVRTARASRPSKRTGSPWCGRRHVTGRRCSIRPSGRQQIRVRAHQPMRGRSPLEGRSAER